MRRDVRALLRRPLVVAPMAGGPSTPSLVAAAAEAGALGMLAGGYKSAGAVIAEIGAVRGSTSEAFGVNLFVPGSPSSAPDLVEAYVRSLAVEADEVGATCGEAVWDDDHFEEKLNAVVAAAPALVTF